MYSLPSTLFMAILFLSCGESEDPGKYKDWRVRNEAFIDSLQRVYTLKTDPELKAITYPRNKDYTIYYKILEEKPSGQPPFYTSTVYYYFREMLIDEVVFGASPSPRYCTKLYKNLDVLKTNMGSDAPTEFDSPREYEVSQFEMKSGEVTAYTVVFQRMKIGERWEVYIPWQLAYGSAGNGYAPGYSTVISDVILEKVDY